MYLPVSYKTARLWIEKPHERRTILRRAISGAIGEHFLMMSSARAAGGRSSEPRALPRGLGMSSSRSHVLHDHENYESEVAVAIESVDRFERVHSMKRGGEVGRSSNFHDFSKFGKKGAEALHTKLGGSREKHAKIRAIWHSSKYQTRDRCAEQECDALGMSYSAARKALRNTPDPKRT